MNVNRPAETKRLRFFILFFGGFVFSTLLFWAVWAIILKGIFANGIWMFLIFFCFQLLLGSISYVSYKISLKRWKREIAKASEGENSPENAVEDDKKVKKAFRMLRIIQVICVFFLLWFPVLLYVYFFRQNLLPLIELDSINLIYLQILLTVISITSLWYAYRFPKILLKSYKKSPYKSVYRPSNALVTSQILRVALSNILAIYGFILGIFGASWQITGLFFLSYFISQILIFPTIRKWQRELEEIREALAPDKQL